MSIKTNNTSLMLALTKQDGEAAARIAVSREGKSITYEELTRIKSRDLVGYDITLLQDRVSVISGKEHYFNWQGIEHILNPNESAARELEDFYQLGIAVLSGN